MTLRLRQPATVVAAVILLSCGGSEPGNQTPTGPDGPIPQNQAPTVSIVAPSDGASLTQGASLTLVAEASDPEDGSIQGGAVRWFISGSDDPIGVGATVEGVELLVGDYELRVVATDSRGQQASDSVSFSLTAPTDGSQPATGTVELPDGSQLDPVDLVISGFHGTAGVAPSGGFVVPVLEGGANLIAALDSVGNPLLFALAGADDDVTLSPRSTAVGLLAMWEGLGLSTDSDSYFDRIAADSRVSSLETIVTGVLSEGGTLESAAPQITDVLLSASSSPLRASTIPHEEEGVAGLTAVINGGELVLTATTAVSYAVRIFEKDGEPVDGLRPAMLGGPAPMVRDQGGISGEVILVPGLNVASISGQFNPSDYATIGQTTPVRIDLPFDTDYQRYSIIARSGRSNDDLEPSLVAGEWEGLQLAAIRRDRDNQLAQAFAQALGVAGCNGAVSALWTSEWVERFDIDRTWEDLSTQEAFEFLNALVQRAKKPENAFPAAGECLQKIAASSFFRTFGVLFSIASSAGQAPAALAVNDFVKKSRPRFDGCVSLTDPLDPSSQQVLGSYRCLKLDVAPTLALPVDNLLSASGTPVPLQGTLDIKFVASPVVEESARGVECADDELECAAPRAQVYLSIDQTSLEWDSRFWENKPFAETTGQRERQFLYQEGPAGNWQTCESPRIEAPNTEKGVGCQRILMGSEGEHAFTLVLADEANNVMEVRRITQQAAGSVALWSVLPNTKWRYSGSYQATRAFQHSLDGSACTSTITVSSVEVTFGDPPNAPFRNFVQTFVDASAEMKNVCANGDTEEIPLSGGSGYWCLYDDEPNKLYADSGNCGPKEDLEFSFDVTVFRRPAGELVLSAPMAMFIISLSDYSGPGSTSFTQTF